ncbi:Hint domain-containing protein [Pararhizobium sp. BT-229]|uniref:Hint domain-containing protein n=1 Tax=Pararhizobium sp. BT-229 TaxID=2986923 RepID=UPI0021F74521|nr:Hint domain-containing protein [Pararhizobium sp. BT-229]MCV9967689.1 Hint domain-containing protein [Pararhizobium sp. BT-229]
MSSNKEPHVHLNNARRHFLGLAAATGAKAAAMGALAATTIFPASIAQAMGKPWWKKGGGDGDPMCLLRGTSIMTPAGEVCIENLQIGDLVETVRGKAMAVRWIGRHVYKRSGVSWLDSVVPIRIARHAFDAQTPHRDLYVSPGHALLIDGVLIRAKDLVNGTSIAPDLPADRDTIEYFHIVLDSHEAILAEGAAAETFLVAANNHEGFTNFADFSRLHPAGQHVAMTPFAPIVGLDSGREHLKVLLPVGLRRILQVRESAHGIRRRFAARAEELAS